MKHSAREDGFSPLVINLYIAMWPIGMLGSMICFVRDPETFAMAIPASFITFVVICSVIGHASLPVSRELHWAVYGIALLSGVVVGAYGGWLGIGAAVGLSLAHVGFGVAAGVASWRYDYGHD